MILQLLNRASILAPALFLLAVDMTGCAIQATPSPVPTATLDYPKIALPVVYKVVRQHDETAKTVLLRTQIIRENRVLNVEWKDRPYSISQYGLFTASSENMLKIVEGMAARAEFRPGVQEELEVEKDALQKLLRLVQDEQHELRNLVSGNDEFLSFHEAATEAIEAEKEVLLKLLEYYENEEFVRRGSFDPEGKVQKIDEFVIEVERAPILLIRALTLWESAKLRLEVIQQSRR